MNKHDISPFMPPQHASQYTLLKKTIEIYWLPCNNTVPLLNAVKIKTHDSESRGQEEAGCTRRMSVLFTGSTAVKLVNALNKPP